MILVTGGAGFIGSHVVDALIADGRAVRVLDALLPAAHVGTPDYLNPAADFIDGDVRDPATVDAALAGVDAVCHQAAMVGLESTSPTSSTTCATTTSAPPCCWRGSPRRRFGGRLVLASSMVVYGEGRYSCAAHGARARPAPGRPRRAAGSIRCAPSAAAARARAVPETAPLDPRNVYAATKLHQEHLCCAFARETGVPVTALRYHNVYGPRMPRDTPYAGVASIFRGALAAGQRAARV